MIDNRTLQTWLKEKGLYTGAVDGKAGPQTSVAIAKLVQGVGTVPNDPGAAMERVAAEQLFLEGHGFDVGRIDGLFGPKTQAAYDAWLTKQRDTVSINDSVAHQPEVWPRQAFVPTFYGKMGTRQTLIKPPYKCFYDGQLVKGISLHEKVAPSAARVLAKVLEIYGLDRIKELKLNQYSGSLNVRKMRGGSLWSMHSWGIAIDWDAGDNQLNWDHTRALFAKPEYVPWWEAWEAEGWISLGRERDYDWMHVQAARL